MNLSYICQALMVCAFILWYVPCAADSKPITLVQNGQSEYRIGLSAEAGETEQYAAKELQHYIKQISGAELNIVQATPGDNNIILSSVNERPTALRVPVPSNEDAFKIHIERGRVILNGQAPRAALYAVYSFLESIGCRWFAPAYSFYKPMGNELVPKLRSIQLAPGDTTSSPSFLYRKKYVEEGHTHNTENLKQLIDWMGKTRMNVLNCPLNYQHGGVVKWDNWREALIPECRKRGIIIEVGGHGYQNYLPQEKYFDEHQDWFGSVNGKPSKQGNLAFNTANPDAQKTLTDNILQYLRSRPEIQIFDLWPPDGVKWSDEPASESPSVRMGKVTAYVADAVRKDGLPVMVETIAYTSHLAYPTGVTLPNNVMIDICPFNRSYEFLADDPSCTHNHKYVNASNDWTRNTTCSVGLYSYYRKYAWISKPVNMVTMLPHEFKYYHRAGMEGMGSYSEPGDWFSYELQHYELAKLSWNANQNGDELLSDYCLTRYGSAAQSSMKLFYLLMEQIVTKSPTLMGTTEKPLEQIKSMEKDAFKCRDLLKTATESVKDNVSRRENIARLNIMLDYVMSDLTIVRLHLEGKDKEAAQQVALLKKFLADHTEDGLIAKEPRIETAERFYKPFIQ